MYLVWLMKVHSWSCFTWNPKKYFNPHHRHLEFLNHNPTKLFTSRFVSNIININLAYKQIICNCFSKESRINFADFEAISDKEIS
jgi:hypothetical protein